MLEKSGKSIEGRVSFNQMMEGRVQKSNDDYKGYKEVATQEDFDKF